jgi:hypothetical protein
MGDATVFNPSPAIQQFGNIVAQQRAQRAAQDKALIDQMAFLNADGIRDPDKEAYLNKNQDWKNAAIAANQLAPNSRERLQALADSQQKYNDLRQFIAKSKGEKTNEHQLAQQWIGNQHLFDDSAHDKFLKSLQSPIDSENFVPGTDYTNFSRYVDPEKMNNLFDTGKERALNGIRPNTLQYKGKQGDTYGTYVQNQKTIPFNDVATNYLNLATHDKNMQKFLQDQYGNINGNTPLETNALRIHQLMADRNELNGWQHFDNPQFKQNQKPRQTTNNYLTGNTAPQTIPAENAEGKTIGVFSSPNYLPMSKSGINMAGVPSINMQTMQPETPLKSSNKYNIVGLTSAPIANKELQVGNKKIPKGSLLQNNYATVHPEDVEWKDMAHVREDVGGNPDEGTKAHTVDHLVPSNLLPNTLTGTKAWRTQTANYKSYHGNGLQHAPTTTNHKKDPLGIL